MSNRTIRPLAAGYSCEIDEIDEPSWCQLLLEFEDSNIYQTWSYASVVEGPHNMCHLAIKLNGDVVAIAQARIKQVPLVGLGVGYVRYGPLWRRKGACANVEIFRQTVRALRNEFVGKRGLALRIFPVVYDDSPFGLDAILADEGLAPVRSEVPDQTILMDLSPSLADLREGLTSHGKLQLRKLASRNNLELVAGSSSELLDCLIEMYKEMVSRKKFVEGIDIEQYRQIQAELPEKLKMRVVVCQSGNVPCAGAAYSLLGDTAICLFSATSDAGMKSRGSFFIQWKIVEALKRQGASIYDLNGINPVRNPGTYKFKTDLVGNNGREVYFLGKFDAMPGPLSHALIRGAEALKSGRKYLMQKLKNLRRSRQKENA